MLIVKDFVIRDILDYEDTEGISIIDELEQGELFILVDLIQMSIKCSEEDANDILSKALNESSLPEIIEKVVDSLIGRRAEKSEETVNKKEYKNFSDILLDFYTQIQIVDTLSYSDFMHMTTRQLYRYADGLQARYINNKNQELQSQFNNVAMLLGAVTGKLKECPQLDEEGHIKKKSLRDKLAAINRR